MVEIVQKEEKVLRKIAKEVSIPSITTPKIQKIISDMNEALDSQDDGAAIAAPQIGVSLRIFIISGKVFDDGFVRDGQAMKKVKNKTHPNLVFINPVIKKMSKDRKLLSEGCLSVRPVYGKVRRATRVTLEAYNENGKKFTIEGTGLLAHAFQHEYDHLEGILFIDKAKDLQEILAE